VSKNGDATQAEYDRRAASAFPWPGKQSPAKSLLPVRRSRVLLLRANDLSFGAASGNRNPQNTHNKKPPESLSIVAFITSYGEMIEGGLANARQFVAFSRQIYCGWVDRWPERIHLRVTVNDKNGVIVEQYPIEQCVMARPPTTQGMIFLSPSYRLVYHSADVLAALDHGGHFAVRGNDQTIDAIGE
jgi:hypothetical protein